MQLRLNSLGTRQAACGGVSTQPWLSSPMDSLPSGSAQPLAIPSPPVVIDGGGAISGPSLLPSDSYFYFGLLDLTSFLLG